jgi:ABC-type spermidine/putrescine transport system permease subunit II
MSATADAPPRQLLGLRVAVTLVCLALCSGLICLWVRSYYAPPVQYRPYPLRGWMFQCWQGAITIRHVRTSFELSVSSLFAVLLLGTLAGLPWVQWSRRFSLRELLIIMALIALVLGLIVGPR